MCHKSTQHGKVSRKHLEIPQIPMAVLPVDTQNVYKSHPWGIDGF